ncbi:hypothetical protein B0T10DRAFT_497498 [Thelonectria olida]|uniref:Uncharacterized protein n=1 Tax=Thelonectria olida TaxID=1576542 RepID=A0A9P8VVW5_9HYPO|nr:hypothetical protein B0T10DRAFT_497498 [Thelonectria olida]
MTTIPIHVFLPSTLRSLAHHLLPFSYTDSNTPRDAFVMMLLPTVISIIVGLTQLSLARKADTRMYGSECREFKSFGKTTCAYCNWNSTPHCDITAFWDSCRDDPTPNPCRADELIVLNSRDYVWDHDDTCKRVCPGQRCYSETNKYQTKCCRCPKGYVPSVTPPTCRENRGSDVGVSCVGCEGPDEKLVGNDQKGWECQPVCNRACSKDTWCPASWVKKTGSDGKTVQACQCNSGNCKGRDATCPSTCLGSYQTPKTCPKLSCPNVVDKDTCFPSQEGLDLIKSTQSHCSTFYNACDGVKRIGWRHNCNTHKDCGGLTLPLSPCESERLLKCDVKEMMQRVKALPNYRRLSLNQFSALVSLAYQHPAAFDKTRAIWKHMDVKASEFDYRKVCNDILTATSDNKSTRQKESKLCLKAPVTKMKC